MPVNLSAFSNSDYKPGNFFKRGLWYVFNIIFMLNPFNPFMGLKRLVLRIFGAKIGRRVIIKPAVNIKYPWFLEIGDYSWIGERVWIDNLGKTSIGAHVCISQGALLLCGNHNYKKETFDLMVGEIKLADGVWIGARAIVTGGVVAQSHAVLTAGSVANGQLNAYTVYQGNPAVILRQRNMENHQNV